ncbi:hypothetical protein N836_30075 [Leptolyngbya sp. Heron Island J]|uniref:hypothetical protein n=1 Tax=Leptolyngbya sp. Heron Island J TaxID=1385935 RepID=UPI0003B9B8F3|nr:hypothetical protein [Leptolyngbya sp. Heron Island J]ESA38776.1 hypothetical protein N836_30075 [Leptolyngbya sp. Heron Island J]
MKAIAIVGSTDQSQTLLADLLHWHGLSVFQVDINQALLPVLSFVSPELIIVESAIVSTAEAVCDRIKCSTVLGNVPVIVCADHDTDRSRPSGADAHLYAPYTAEDIFAHIQALRPLVTPLDSIAALNRSLDVNP